MNVMWSSSPGFGVPRCPCLNADEVVKLALGRSGLSGLGRVWYVVVLEMSPGLWDMRVAVLKLLESSLPEVNLSENMVLEFFLYTFLLFCFSSSKVLNRLKYHLISGLVDSSK